MSTIDEIKESNFTSSYHKKAINDVKKEINDVKKLLSNFDELKERKIDFYQNYLTIKKIRKKNTHLTPKKKKRKK